MKSSRSSKKSVGMAKLSLPTFANHLFEQLTCVEEAESDQVDVHGSSVEVGAAQADVVSGVQLVVC